MEFWEFLIQKEGDRSWLPLESPDVEILEGRYRVVARSSRTNSAVDIRIIHDAITDFLPIRRIQKRSGRTNPDGLMVVFPYTRLLPGTWELRCTSDLMADMMGEDWHSSVRLQVLPIEFSRLDPEEDSIASSSALGAVPAHPVLMERSPAAIALTAPPDQLAPPLVAPAALAVESDDGNEPLPDDSLENAPLAAGLESAPDTSLETAAAPVESPELTVEAVRGTAVYQTAAEISEQVVEAIFQDLTPLVELPPAPPPLPRRGSDRPTAATSPAIASWVRLSLDQEMYVVQQAQPLILTGQVETLEQVRPSPAPVSGWRIRLYDPQTAQVLVDNHQPIADRVPPFPLSCTVPLPTDYQTYLLLGELILYGVAAEGTPPVLATQSFSVTTDLHELLEAIANDFSEPEELPQLEVALSDPGAASSKLDFPEVASSSPLALAFQPAPAQPLPPQLRPPESTKERKSLELPTFVNASATTSGGEQPDNPTDRQEMAIGAQATQTIEAANTADEAKSETDPTTNLETNAAMAAISAAVDPLVESANAATTEDSPQSPAEPLAAPEWTDLLPIAELHPAVRVDLASPAQADSQSDAAELAGPLPEFPMREYLDDWADPSLDWDSIEPRLPSWHRRENLVEPATTPEDVAFRSLNLQERFWTRLQSLATDAERSAWLDSSEAADGVNPEPDALSLPSAPDAETPSLEAEPAAAAPQGPPIGLDADLVAQEIVVEDDLPPIAQPPHAAVARPEMKLAADEPIPMPQLEITTTELIAGKPVHLIAKLPSLLPRVVIKLWLRDRQTRSLIDQPRWIVDFTPDGFGNLIARTQVTIPYGCLELQLEAIAVEMTTLRESEKVTLTRRVMPANLSLLSLDQFDL